MATEYYDEQQQQLEQRPQMFSSLNFSHASSIINLTNPEDEIVKMELKLRSCRMDKDSNLIRIGEPLLNDLGINSVVSIVQSIVSRTSILSNFSKNEVPALMDFLSDTLAEDLMINRKAYGIKSSNDRNKIFFNALTTAFICLKRGFEEGDRKFWKGSVQEIRSTNEVNKKGGVLSRLNPFSR